MREALSQPNLSRELEVARRLAVEAGAVALRYHGTDLQVDKKAGDEPVTRADREASALIVAGLTEAFPEDLVISEEAPERAGELTGSTRAWFVDPIDGTKDFIRGEDGFAVMIGLVLDGRPRLGVVYQPVGGRLYIAAPGVGARLIHEGTWRDLRCSPTSAPSACRLVVSRSHRSTKIDRVKEVLAIDQEVGQGSVGLKIGMLAADEVDLYVNPSDKSKAWDTCGPEAILVEAGGRITDLDGEPLRYDDAGLWNLKGLVASNGASHDAVMSGLQPLMGELMPA